MRELNVAETEEVSGGCCLLLGGLVLGALAGLDKWGGSSWGGNGGGCGPAPAPAPSNNCGCGTSSFPVANGGWIGGSFNDVLNNIIHSA
ncbi:hypothetical protein LWC05_03665 [Acetobacter sicerae]|uniref:Uncharacterized protein n=1 Tax=Acetobacter sicerae TaxID=85325 RepID=A0ABS8VTU5_9PROT|nr:hypothetical protein [Acetobacter sicerae]MCE0742989.1 hypothetical protein [Acetobacter sicerae]NHN90891.1 hypothetical protein [Acetobacter sicerae]